MSRSYHKKIQIFPLIGIHQGSPDLFIEWNPARNEITIRIEAKEAKETWEKTLKIKQDADINVVFKYIQGGIRVASRCCSTKDFINRAITAIRRLETFEAFRNGFLQ